MADLRLIKGFQGKAKSYPEGLTINISDELLDDILSGRRKAKPVVEAPPRDKMFKGIEEEVEKKTKGWFSR